MDATADVTPTSRGSEEQVDPPTVDRAEVRRELEATLSARRELGPEYDTQLADSFIEQVTAKISAQLADMQRQVNRVGPQEAPSHAQRLGLAIVSMCMLVPLTAVVLGIGAGLGGLAMLLALILAINLGFRYL